MLNFMMLYHETRLDRLGVMYKNDCDGDIKQIAELLQKLQVLVSVPTDLFTADTF